MTAAGLGKRYRIEPLGKHHDRSGFSCGVEPLDRYFHKQASQDAKKKVATVFVAVDNATGAVHGFYTLSAAGIPLDRLPAGLARALPRYASLPAIRLGRLAVHGEARGNRLGAYLLMDALYRAHRNEIAWVVFLVDAKDENAREFYGHFDFMSFADNPLHMFLPRPTIESMFA